MLDRRTRPLVAAALAALLSLGTSGAVALEPDARPRTLAFAARSDTVDLAGLEQRFARIAQRASPAVVAITVGDTPAPADGPARSSELTPAALDGLLRNGSRIIGTGFCVDPSGYILTNEHVVAGAQQLYVTTDDGRVLPAMVVATDPRGDLAMLKVPATLPSVSFAPAPARRGQWTIALGNPVGLSGHGAMSFSVGVVSAIGRELPKLSAQENRVYSNLIQTTAEVNPGNSGGPLFDLDGRVIGVVTAVVLPQRVTNGLGFALPADADLLRRVNRLRAGLAVEYGFLGIAGRSVPGGVQVTRVGAATPAAGQLQLGDVIRGVNGQTVADEPHFVRLIGACPTDRPVAIAFDRVGRRGMVRVQLDARTDATGIGRERQVLRWRGVTFETTATAGIRVADVDAASPFAATASPGQRLRSVAGQAVRDLPALLALLDRLPPDQCRLGVEPGVAAVVAGAR